MRRLDLSGQRFGRLLAVKIATRNGGAGFWECLCECGTQCTVAVGKLRSGHTKSCGCYRLQRVKETKTTHGRKRTGIPKDPTYEAWSQMAARCQCASSTRIERYINRGITVCDRWRHSFENFLGDMGERPSPDHSLERENNDLGYSPENCCWATRITQGNNKRNNKRYPFRGQMMTVREMLLTANSNVAPRTVWARLNTFGWPAERAVSDAPGAYKCR